MEIPQTVELTSSTAPEGALSAYGPGERPKLSLVGWDPGSIPGIATVEVR